jgi:type II secretory pathway pseudopilin PulG
VIELAICVLIVSILAALLAPLMTAKVRDAKWSEGRAGAGALATGIRTYCAETGTGHPAIPAGGSFADFRVYEVDLTGKYFQPGNYSVSPVVYDRNTGSISYLITVRAPASIGGADKTLDQAGTWSDGR